MQLKNFSLLVLSFFVGQGSVFLVQTWLLTSGEMKLLGDFGFIFSFFILGVTLVEAGSVVIISRYVLSLGDDSEFSHKVSTVYWNVTLFRFCLAVFLVSISFFVFLFFVKDKSFFYLYFIGAFPGLIFWAFSFSGILDGLKLSGLSGFCSSFPYFISALALLFVGGDENIENPGWILGCAFSIGYLLSIIIQIVFLSRTSIKFCYVCPRSALLIQYGKDCVSMLAGLLPGQLYQRSQLAICRYFVGVDATAIYLYAKQIINSGSQLVGFARRVEFYVIVEMIGIAEKSILKLLLAQRKSLFAALIVFLGMVILSYFLGRFSVNIDSSVSLSLLWISITLISESIGTSLMQVLYASTLFMKVANIRLFAVIIGMVFSLFLTPVLGIKGLVLSDIVVHLLVAFIGVKYMKSRGFKWLSS